MSVSLLGLLQNPAPAQPQGESGGSSSMGWTGIETIVFIGVMFLVMWFVLIRPQQKEQKRRMEMLSKIKKNDHVVTASGIFGVVQNVKENEVILRIDDQNNTRIRVLRSAILSVEKEASADETETVVSEKK